MRRRDRKTSTPHVGKELPKQELPTVSDTVIAAFLAVLFVGCAIYAAGVGGVGWAIAVILGFLGLVAASMTIEQTRTLIAASRARSVASPDRPKEWPVIETVDE